MIDAPLAFAFTAGLVATVNPCGFAMLPAYLSWYLGTDADDDAGERHLADRFGRALHVGGVVSIGFLVVFGAAGTLITVGVRSFVEYVPQMAIVIGALVALLGVYLLSGRQLTFALPKPQAGTSSRRVGSMFTFGASYAIASLSCTLPVFMAVVVSTFTRTNVASGIAGFIAYALGMSVVLLIVTLAIALTEHSLVAAIRRASRYVNRAAGVLLIVAGGYVVYYWVINLSTEPGETSGTGLARFVERLSARATTRINNIGWQNMLLAAAAIIGAAVTVVIVHRHSRRTQRARPSGDIEPVDEPVAT